MTIGLNMDSARAPIAQSMCESGLLSAIPSERLPAPNDVWDFNQHNTWHPVAWRLISDFAGADVRNAFLKAPPEYLVSDDLGWLDSLVHRVRGIEVDSKHELTSRLLKHFRAIRACHGTSVPCVDSIYEMGLRPLITEEFHNQARNIFFSRQFPELSEANLQRAIESVGPVTREGRVYFEANERFLIEMCGHYMLYGSEYLTALAANFGGTRDYRRVLKGRYPPTLLICDVPLDYLHPGTVAELAGVALESIFQELLDGATYAPDRWRGSAFSIQGPLEPACIAGHYHPTIARDPLR